MNGLFRIALRVIMVGAGVIFTLAVACRVLGIVFNPTHSAPPGFYIRAARDLRHGGTAQANFILFCPDQKWPGFNNNPPYRAGWSNCPDGNKALLKPVVAWAGDTVTVTPLGVAVNGSVLHNSMPLSKDTNGEVLHAYPLGNYNVKPGELWVISSHSRKSFDSRYYGPIPETSIRTWVRPLLTFGH